MIRSDNENLVYTAIDEFFRGSTPASRKNPKWRVPIGMGYFDEREVKAAVECYLNGWLSTQNKVKEFEAAFANYLGVTYAIATNSGSSANLLALDALMQSGALVRGDEVIVPATTFVTVVTPIIQLGLIPVYVDIDPHTLNIDPKLIESAIVKGKTKAIMVVHTLGNPAPMKEIMDIANREGLVVIEDCCEAHGAMVGDRKVGSFGDLATFSFYVAHNMTTGEGGMVVTNSSTYARLVAQLREFGRHLAYLGNRYGYSDGFLTNFDERYVFSALGYNFRMADPPAAFGMVQLQRLDDTNSKRIMNATAYMERLNILRRVLYIPEIRPDTRHVFYGFPIVIKQESGIPRTSLVRYLEAHKIETRAIFCGTLPDQPCFRDAPGRSSGLLNESRMVRDNGFFIGCHPGLNDEDIVYVVDKLIDFCAVY
ncbi:MAG: DegT/DnrJ/EryC1/StrS family aminotransferase [Patescibacteria group bacterium]